MEELAIEEKAKRYDEVIMRAKEKYAMFEGMKQGDVLEDVFPELKENEDERMWKLIKKYAHYNISDIALEADHITREQLESWLKKQGEPNPYSGVSFKYSGHTWGMCARDNGVEILIDGHLKGRVFTNNDSNAKEMFIKALEHVEEQNSKGHKLTDCDKNSWWEDFKARTSNTIEPKFKGKSALEAINEEKVESIDKYEGFTDFERTLADICISWIGEEPGWEQYIKGNADALLKIAIKKFNSVQGNTFKGAWSERDDRMLEDIVFSINQKSVIEGLKRRGINYSLDISARLTEDLINWIKAVKDRVLPQSKQEWSEEDKKKVNNLYVLLDQMVRFNILSDKDATEFKNWLRYLKERVQFTWEPSDEQINTLEYYMHTLICNKHKEILLGLYTDLKKLKG